ncbi:ferredoxin [Actinocrispum wychmicini]|uniref:ferredoxin n=1 Tax=Actinocrispum wychmicini TaxID=1213861 RepID=UPI001A9D19B6|nr:ferredoxin [Actinocrispum wychmicini]
MANYDGDRPLGPPTNYLRGEWERRDWRNVPGPFYGAATDSCWMGREIAPRHIVYEDEYGSEIVFRQPQDRQEVLLLLTAAWNDPFRAYACDGDIHWTLALIREWWAGRERIAAWIQATCQRMAASEREDERDNASGLRDYAGYLSNGLEAYLRQYGFWLDHHRPALPGETLPDLRLPFPL